MINSMIWKLSNLIMTIVLMIGKGNYLEVKAAKNNIKKNLITRFCYSTLKSKVDKKDQQDFQKIASFTCECFYKKFKSGTSIKKSRLYCKQKTSEKFNL